MGSGHPDGGLRLDLLGPLRLWRGGVEIVLPASRKTRALLAYLALADRPVRRDHLCSLLWDLPDDPRGALRWSLSKLRGLLDDPGRPRLIADRDTVRLDRTGIAIDALALDAARDPAAMPIDGLRAVARREGELLEGLDLPRCEGFQAWAIARREDMRRSQCRILAALARRSDDADEALAAARAWTRLDPFDADARLLLVERLAQAGRHAEIAGQRALGLAKLDEGEMAAPTALRSGAPRAASAPRPAAGSAAGQQVRFCKASDGTGLAWSRVGDGAALVKTANWLNHLEYDWDSPVWRHWIAALTRRHALVRYDERGNGLSDWDAKEISFAAFVDDLASVADAAGLDRFDLLGVSQGCSVAIAYAVRHPQRVRRLVLYGGYAAGWRSRGEPAEIARRSAMLTLLRDGWGQNNPAFRQMYTSLFFPDASQAEMDWFNELQRMTTSPANAERLSNAFADADVRDLTGQVSVPTLVLHARDDAVIPFDAGRSMAAAIPGAQFVALDSRNHLLLETEPAWARFVASVDAFLAD